MRPKESCVYPKLFRNAKPYVGFLYHIIGRRPCAPWNIAIMQGDDSPHFRSLILQCHLGYIKSYLVASWRYSRELLIITYTCTIGIVRVARIRITAYRKL